MIRTVFLAAALTAGLATSAHADTYKSIDQCVVGAHVADKSNKTGTIVHVDRSESLCQVRLDGGGDNYYLFWMLRTAGASPYTSASLVAGKYECYANGNYTYMDITITGPGTYNAEGGGGTYHRGANNAIVFDSGSLRPYRAILKPGPSIGLNSNGDSFYGTVCDLAK